TYSGVSRTATLSISRLTLQGLTLSASSVATGLSVSATVSLAAPAAAAGVVVALSSSASGVVVPPTVAIGAGQSTATFDVGTLPNALPAVATLTASIPGSGSVRTATLSIGPLRLESLSIGFTQWPGGTSAVGLLNLSVAAPPAGAVVALQSSSPVAAVAATVTIPPGVSEQEFPIDVANVPPTRAVTITATYGDRSSAVTFTAVALPLIASLPCAPLTLARGTPI